MKLVVIEGIGKKETVEKYLGAGYRVFATKGHVVDLPPKALAVNVKNNFEPKYVVMDDKADVVKSLKEAAAKAEDVLLATDPDREGEAISWHVARLLGIPQDKKARIEFNEISKKAVQNALKNPRCINENLVDAQQARRVLDRLVGYKISPVLCKKIQGRLSAGRVQSVTLRLVVEREREILNFKPEEYWPFSSILENDAKFRIKAALVNKHGKKFKITDRQTLDEVISELDGKEYVVDSVKKSVTKSRPMAPFITSTMQQDALNKLGMNLKQTTEAAQKLYEGVEVTGEGKVALVTYIRTDSTRVSAEAQADARKFIEAKYGVDFVPPKPNIYASKKNAQDAHEAIRPISIARTPESLDGKIKDRNCFRLYKLIYERFLASQMSEAKYNSMVVTIDAGDYGFKVSGKTPLFAGYTIVYSAYESDKTDKESEEGETEAKLPELTEGQKLNFIEYKYEQKFTKPPARFTEASLVKTMEEKGIGRPATYTPTVTLLFSREYTEKDGKFIKPTELGMKVTDMLVKYFPEIMDVGFTANMEERLDEIEEGGKVWQQVVASFYNGFEDKIALALDDSFSLKEPPTVTDVRCDKCGVMMVLRTGRKGKFLACPNFPKCKNTMDYDERTGTAVERESGSTEETDIICDVCGAKMILRNGRYGKFLSCSNYPTCKNTMQYDERTGEVVEKKEAAAVVESDMICDKCGRKMVIKQGKFGKFLACPGYPQCKNIKNLDEDEHLPPCPTCGKPLKKISHRGSFFYGCTGYPECKFVSSYKPINEKCPDCGSIMTERVYKGEKFHVCSNKECGNRHKAEDEKYNG